MSESVNEEKPPVFGNWKGWYWLVMLVMIVQVVVYLVITQVFA